tara:strand:+ start:2098 stop:2388 length:291 start_codon:yes stop_codon:yes gene_type:complete
VGKNVICALPHYRRQSYDEQKEIVMCLPTPKAPKPPQESEDAKIERENQQMAEQRKQAENKAEQLERTVKRKRGGRGSMSLLTGSKGGLGYYQGTL